MKKMRLNMLNLPPEHIEQMKPDDILWHGACHTEQDYDNVESERKRHGNKILARKLA